MTGSDLTGSDLTGSDLTGSDPAGPAPVEPAPPVRVFVCYGAADADWARVLAGNLQRSGFEVFFDEWSIQPGDVVVHAIDAAILGSAAGVLVVSPAALARPWVQDEYAAMMTRAVEHGQRIVPVLYRDAVLPPLLAARRPVDFRYADSPAGYLARLAELLYALRGRPASRPEAGTALQVPADLARRPEGPRAAALRISRDEVTVTADARSTSDRPAGPWHRVASAVGALRHARQRGLGAPTRAADAGAVEQPLSLPSALAEMGRALGSHFLGGAAGTALAEAVTGADQIGASRRLAVEVADPDLADLPWETLVLPGHAQPLALHPRVAFYRSAPGLGPTAAPDIPGPLRILAVIGSPERGGGALLDYEAELGQILDAVAAARRRGGAYVRVLEWGSVEAIRAALAAERFHVLHLSCHASPAGWRWRPTTARSTPSTPTGWSARRWWPTAWCRWSCSPAAPRPAGPTEPAPSSCPGWPAGCWPTACRRCSR
jgi:hypothetical protein